MPVLPRFFLFAFHSSYLRAQVQVLRLEIQLLTGDASVPGAHQPPPRRALQVSDFRILEIRVLFWILVAFPSKQFEASIENGSRFVCMV